MNKAVKIAHKEVGPGKPVFVIAEIGINHNGELETAKKLIRTAVEAGCDAVKFQKRTPEVCVPKDQWDKMRETPWGYISYIDYKKKMEFGPAEYKEIDQLCKELGILWFASCWDEESVAFMEKFNPPCHKVASASLTDRGLLEALKKTGKPIILSTGMSSVAQIDQAVEVLGKDNLVLMHTVSTYPAEHHHLNLSAVQTLANRYQVPVGYSGHEKGVVPSVVATALGACAVERHITLDRTMWGTDQAASLEPKGLKMLVKEIRILEQAIGDGVKRVLAEEIPIAEKLRRKKDF
ncbi:MAG: N-acetylneuraminate synthase family protein [Patescibacteria group bacterium]